MDFLTHLLVQVSDYNIRNILNLVRKIQELQIKLTF